MVNRPLIVSLGLLFVVLSCFSFYGVDSNKADCTSLGDGDYICSRTKEPANCCQVTRNKFYTVKCIPTNCTALGGTCDCREGTPNNDACSVSTCCGCTVNCETLSGGAPVSCACHFGSKTACPLNQGECIADCAKVGKVCQVKPGFEIFSKGDCACAVTQGGTCVYPGVTGAPSVTGAVQTVTAAPPVKPVTSGKPRTPYYYPPYYYPPYYYPYPPQPYGPYYPPKVPYGPLPQSYYTPNYGYPGYGYQGYGNPTYRPTYSGSSGSPSYYPAPQGYPGPSSYYPPPPPQGSSYYPSSPSSSGSSSKGSSSSSSSSYNPPYGPFPFASPFNMFQSFAQGSSGYNFPGSGYSG